MKNAGLMWSLGLISGVCACSLVMNVFLVRSNVIKTNQIQDAETYAMGHVAADMNLAEANMKTNKQYALNALAEAGATLLTLQRIVPESTKNHLYNVGYYSHVQTSAVSLKELPQFVENANRLLQSHIVNGQYNLSDLSSDAIRLDQMIPKS